GRRAAGHRGADGEVALDEGPPASAASFGRLTLRRVGRAGVTGGNPPPIRAPGRVEACQEPGLIPKPLPDAMAPARTATAATGPRKDAVPEALGQLGLCPS